MVKIKNFKHIDVQKKSKWNNSLKNPIAKKLLGLEGLRFYYFREVGGPSRMLLCQELLLV